MIINLIKRNLRLYFRDKTTVFFSMLGVLIIIMLYLLFLGDMMVSYAANEFSSTPELNVRFMMDSWIMAGVVSVATITTTLGSYGVIVSDNTSKVINDFRVAPVKRSSIVLAYIISAFVVGVIMSLVSLTFGEIYIIASGGEIISFMGFLKTFGVIMISVLMSSSVVFFIITFIKSNNAFGAVSTAFGSIIGFLMGVYIPIGNLPIGLQTVITYFPFSHSAVILRQVMMSEAVNLTYMPEQFILYTGINLKVGETIVTVWMHIMYMLVISLFFFGLGVLRINKKRKS